VAVGGGIAGLSGARAALDAARRAGVDLDVVVLEASERAGGKLWTEEVDGLRVEWGPDSLLAHKPRGVGLIQELGLAGGLVPVSPEARRGFVLRAGELRPIPAGTIMGVPVAAAALRAAVRSGLLTAPGAARAALEPLLPPARDATEPTVAELARRRLGGDAADHLIEPLVRGVFGGPGAEVGAWSAFPQAEGRRSLTLALRRSRGGPPRFVALRGGFGRLVDALVAALPPDAVRTGIAAGSIEPVDHGFVVRSGDGDVLADAVLLTAPAPGSAELLAEVSPTSSSALAAVRYGASAVVVLRYAHGALGRSMDGSGYLVDPDEGLAVAACSWFSAKWPHAAGGADGAVLRPIVTDPAALAVPDGDLVERVVREVGTTMRARRDPDVVRMIRWERSLPVFGPGHRQRIRSAVAALPSHVALAGAFLGAVGIPDCVASGEEAARHLVGALAGSRP